ncbi:MAG: CBS domain-containing protein [Rhodospirillaceae bacterium]|jgi:CBS domain-containing protein|nr:CBS domain-containing protein [Rhodospirillaceae bacterium]MBT5457429.1 CBS domain-containing protein [Rhodospirillaceae bacterium]
MKLRDVLETKANILHSLDAETDLTAAARLLAEQRIGAVVVLDADGGLQGILSERDISRAFGNDGAAAVTQTVSSVMTSSVITCHPDHDVDELFRSMVDNNIRHLPIVDDSGPIGMLSIRDLARALVQNYESDIQDLKNLLVSLDVNAA